MADLLAHQDIANKIIFTAPLREGEAVFDEVLHHTVYVILRVNRILLKGTPDRSFIKEFGAMLKTIEDDIIT